MEQIQNKLNLSFFNRKKIENEKNETKEIENEKIEPKEIEETFSSSDSENNENEKRRRVSDFERDDYLINFRSIPPHSNGRCYKPVILIYNNEKNVNENVSIKLTLNDAMNIGSTYPHPIVLSEKEEKKEYEWKGNYISIGNESCCHLTIDNKKFDYIFWEGPCIKENEFNGEIIGIK